MNKELKLKIDLIPTTAWYSNLRNVLTKSEWDKIRKKVYKRDNYKCTICNGVGKHHPVEAHEKWEWDFKTKEQILVEIISLCPTCHKVHHYGFNCFNRGVCEPLKWHFVRVNKCSVQDFENHIDESQMIWENRNRINWKLDEDSYQKVIKEIEEII